MSVCHSVECTRGSLTRKYGCVVEVGLMGLFVF